MAKGNIACTKIIILTDPCYVPSDRIAVFYSHEDSHFPFRFQCQGIIRIKGYSGYLAVACHTCLDRVKYGEGSSMLPLKSLGSTGSLPDENGKEFCIKSSLLHSRKIDTPLLITNTRVKSAPEETHGCITVCVYRKNVIMNPFSLAADLLFAGLA